MKTLRRVVPLSMYLILFLPSAWAQKISSSCEVVITGSRIPRPTSQEPVSNPELTTKFSSTELTELLAFNFFGTNTEGVPAYSFTVDGGAHWTNGLFPLATTDGNTWPNGSDFQALLNRALQIDIAGRFFNPTDNSDALVVGTGTISPFKINTPVAVAENAAGSSKSFSNAQLAAITVGSTNYIDVLALDGGQLVSSYSTDAGVHWSPLQVIDPSLTNLQSFRLVVETGPRNALEVFSTQASGTSFDIFADYSVDGGVSWITNKQAATFPQLNFAAAFSYSSFPDAAWNQKKQMDELVYAAGTSTNGSDILSSTYDPVTGTASTPVVINDTNMGNRLQPAVAVDPATGAVYFVWADNRNDNPTQPMDEFQWFASLLYGGSVAQNAALDSTTHAGTLSGVPNLYNRVVQTAKSAVYFPTIQTGFSGPTSPSVVITGLTTSLWDYSATLTGPASVTHGSLFSFTAEVKGPKFPALFDMTLTLPRSTVFKSMVSNPALSCTTPAKDASGKITCVPTSAFSGSTAVAVTLEEIGTSGTKQTLVNSVVPQKGCDGTPNDNIAELKQSVN